MQLKNKTLISFIFIAIDRSTATGDDLFAASGHGGDECLEEFSIELHPTLLDPSFATRSQLTGIREVLTPTEPMVPPGNKKNLGP